ncbi:phage tail assembly protein [Vitreoscilla massiliensis]|uniref:phage tail assembly protein n=1 Tax=Vitreoscilla massiliensis TaxID=1689272 RepID=UPI00071C9818|nr:phage tail assembly protein [Vitreoscilla massiliensis]
MQNKAGIKIIDNETIEVTLSNGATHIMHEPQGHAMRGLSLDMVRAKVTDQVQPLYARICEPIVSRKQFETMGLSDISLLNAALDFFYADAVGKKEIREIYQSLYETDSTATTAGESEVTSAESLPANSPASLTDESTTTTPATA